VRRCSLTTSRHSILLLADLLVPFAMCRPLTCSDCDETSVPLRAHRSAADLSWPGPAARHPGRPPKVPTFTSCSIGQAGTQLYPGTTATPTPPTFGVASPPFNTSRTGVGFLAKRKPCAASRPISARFEPVLRLVGVNHWFALAVPSGPASRTHTIWPCWRVPTLSELLPALPALPGAGCSQLQPGRCNGRTRKVFHLPSNINAS
jgi:hypothetical protein